MVDITPNFSSIANGETLEELIEPEDKRVTNLPTNLTLLPRSIRSWEPIINCKTGLPPAKLMDAFELTLLGTISINEFVDIFKFYKDTLIKKINNKLFLMN